MQNLAPYVLAGAIGYLIGSVSVARIIFARLRPGVEPERIRMPTTDGQAELVSHAIGATSVMIAFGPRWGLLTTILDIAKAFVPVLALRLAFPTEIYHLVLAVAVLIGHIWPVWYRFSGGGGNSCVIGMLLAISPVGFLVTHAGGMLIGKLIPMMSFMAGVLLMIPWFIWRDGIASPETVFAVLIALLYFAGQIPEIVNGLKIQKQGHKIEVNHVMSQMKRSAKPARNSTKATGPDTAIALQDVEGDGHDARSE